ncbi:MAG TPA: MOSC N-terminal beta barrel domain-containing protein [Opitutaceae bacterium]|jgi:hypothetical protein|nr:MOSC N-terminal beta barrel domain-containing protein [Opitutaceae bacterium]
MSGLRVSRIFIQPVKSLRGHEVAAAEVDELGLVGDRRFVIADAEGRFLTQRTLPRMATIAARVADGTLRLTAPDMPELTVPLRGEPDLPKLTGPLRGEPGAATLRRVTIWKSEGLLAEDCGSDAARWLGAALGRPCSLLRAGPDFVRPIPLHRVPEPLKAAAPRVACNDAFPFMVVGEASLADLNDRLAAEGLPAVPMERFRPSFAVAGGEPFAEDTWASFQVGGLTLYAAGRCARCIVTCLDPWSGDRGVEPLRLLSAYRRDSQDPTQVMFGQNAIHAYAGPGRRIAVGDPVDPQRA